MITVDRSQRIFQLASEVNTAAAALLASTQLRTICAWCSVTMREGPLAPVSHGCCEACSDTLVNEALLRKGLEAIRAAGLDGGGVR